MAEMKQKNWIRPECSALVLSVIFQPTHVDTTFLIFAIEDSHRFLAGVHDWVKGEPLTSLGDGRWDLSPMVAAHRPP